VQLELRPPRNLGKELVKTWIVIRNAKRKLVALQEGGALIPWLESLLGMCGEAMRFFVNADTETKPSAMELAIDEFKERLPGFHAELMKIVAPI
jgi:hypothetical protein